MASSHEKIYIIETLMRFIYIISALILTLILMPIALGCKPVYGPFEDVIIDDAIISTGASADCNCSIYFNNTLINTTVMTKNGLAYRANFSVLPVGDYLANIECDNGFTGECEFEVKEEDDTVSLMIILGFALIIGFLLLAGAANIKLHKLNSSKISFYMTFICFGLALIEFTMIPYVMAVMYESGSIMAILETNFIILFVLSFTVLFFTLFRYTLQLMRFDEADNLKKW